MASNHVVQEKINQKLRLCIFHALNPGNELAIEEKGFPAGDRVDPNEWVHGVDRVFADQTTGLTDVRDHL